MEPTSYIWMDGEFVDWDDAQVHVLTHTLHYGSGVFEGIRAYNTEKGTAIFQLQPHVDRLFYSAGVIAMQIPFSKEEITDACVQIVSKNSLEETSRHHPVFDISLDSITHPSWDVESLSYIEGPVILNRSSTLFTNRLIGIIGNCFGPTAVRAFHSFHFSTSLFKIGR